jgi:hypothetical protein
MATTMTGPRLTACLAVALILAGGVARADGNVDVAPDQDPAPPAFAPTATGAAPVAPVPALEAADTAPTTAQPLPAAQPQVVQGPLTPRPEPFYRKPWFWGGVAALCLVAAIVGTFTLGSSEAPTPQTTLGDMHAF